MSQPNITFQNQSDEANKQKAEEINEKPEIPLFMEDEAD